MTIDIRIIVTIIYLLVNYFSLKFSDDTGYIPDLAPAFVLLFSTICYLLFWIVYLVVVK